MKLAKLYIRYVRTAFLAASLLFLQTAYSFAEDVDDAQTFIDNLADKAFATIAQTNLSPKQREDEFRALLSEGLDVDFVANFVLGPYRRKASADQIARFSDILEDYIVLTYAYRFKEFKVVDLIVTGAEIGKRNTIIVASDLDLPDDAPDVHIDWRTHKKDGGWKVIDISIEGLSMMTVQREEYVAVIRQGGGNVEHLIEALEKKNEKLAKRSGS